MIRKSVQGLHSNPFCQKMIGQPCGSLTVNSRQIVIKGVYRQPAAAHVGWLCVLYLLLIPNVLGNRGEPQQYAETESHYNALNCAIGYLLQLEYNALA